MSSQRMAIRQAIVNAIKDKTDAGAMVAANRILPVWQSELPLIIVYTKDESATVYDETPLLYQRKLKIAIEIAAELADGVDDELDTIADQVETVLKQDFNLGGLCRDVLYQQTEIEFFDDGKDPIAACRLTYEITYFSDGVADESALTDLKEVNGNIQNPTTGDEMPFDISIPT